MRRRTDRQGGYPARCLAGSLAAWLLLGALALGTGGCGRQTTEKPNVVLVVIDTLRFDHLPFYGYAGNTAPFLTDLARQGVVFDTCYSASTWTSPATASMMTSLYPFQHGVHKGLIVTLNQQSENSSLRLNSIPQSTLTLSEWLHSAGYQTFAVADNLNICEAEGFNQGFDHFVTLKNLGADQVNRQVMLWEKKLRAARPYFLYLHYMDPHAPYRAHKPWYVAGADTMQDNLAKYDSEIRFVDEQIRDIFDKLAWDENTILVVTADHGEEFFEHGQVGHGKSLYNETLRVPLLIWAKDKGLRPKRIAGAITSLDIMPTLGAMLGLPARKGFSGISLWPVARDGGLPPQRPLFAQLLTSRPGGTDAALRATIWEQWKFIVTDELFRELYDTHRHPRELVNQYGRADTEALAGKLNGLFLSFKTRCPVFPQDFKAKKVDAKLLEELKTLGYVQ